MMRSVSSWSLHRTLGRYVAPESAVHGGPFMEGPSESRGLALLELPEALKRRGYGAVQICHFHLPSRSPEYLAQLRAALRNADIALETLLIDDGDLTDPERADQVEAWMSQWLDVAAALGATRARLMVGRADPTPALIRECAARLARLASARPDVRIVIENWSGMLRDAPSVQAMLQETGDAVGLLIDLGNWHGPHKYEELARIASFAESCHAKCRFTGAEPDAEDFRRSLQVLKDAGYNGPLALIYDGPEDDEWAMLELEHELCRGVFA
jgi:sugar phosphate isomerase/epimerase